MAKLTLIARVQDGLPLAEGLDNGRKQQKDLEFYKQQAKSIFKKFSQGLHAPSRMTVETGPYVFHYIIESRVCYLTLCERSYPKKLAFQYLEELQREFEKLYLSQVETVARPYAFIKFGQRTMAMGERVDVLIFGASGFTGKYVLREFLKFNQVQIAIAGRSESKLVEALKWASKSASPPQIPIFQADINKPDSLARICSVTRLLVSCVGPFRLYGEPVVKACVEAGIDYLDITGEPEFMERMEAAYHSKALENGSLVVSACGYDSIPAELGLIFNSRQWVPPSVPNSVDSYLVLHSSGRIRGNIGTYESAVLGIASARELQKLRASRPRRPRLQVPGPGPKKLSLVHWEENSGTWALKLPSADAIVVRRTMATMAAYPQGLPAQEDEEKEDAKLKRQKAWETLKPVHFGVFISLKKLWHVVAYIIFGAFFLLMANFKLGRDLLLRYPEFFTAGVFSKDGPSEEEVKNASFSMWFVGNGFSDSSKIQAGKKPDQQIVTRITGPEIGYVTTPIVLVQAALVVLTSRKSLPKGGVLTPGAVFGITDLQERLQKNGISFDVVSIKSI